MIYFWDDFDYTLQCEDYYLEEEDYEGFDDYWYTQQQKEGNERETRINQERVTTLGG
jgi:hypothetical protein